MYFFFDSFSFWFNLIDYRDEDRIMSEWGGAISVTPAQYFAALGLCWHFLFSLIQWGFQDVVIEAIGEGKVSRTKNHIFADCLYQISRLFKNVVCIR